MAGSGGSSGQAMEPHQAHVHALILRGYDTNDPVRDWGDADIAPVYATDPNVMQFLLDTGLDAAGGNVFDGASAYDPGGDLAGMSSAISKLETAVDAIDEEVDAASFFDTAHAKVWTVTEQDLEALFSAAAARVLSHAVQVMTQSHTQSKADARDVLDAIVDDATTYSAELVASLDPDITPVMSTALANSSTGILPALQMGLSAALDATLDGLLDNAIASRRRRALRTHLRSVNRFTAGMADINAVNSSTFIIGAALLESDFEQLINDAETELAIQLYKDTFAQFMETFRSTVNTHTGLYNGRYNVVADLAKTLTALGLDSHKALTQMHAGIADARPIYDSDLKGRLTETALNADIGKATDALLVSTIQAAYSLRHAMGDRVAALQVDYNKMRTVAYVDQYDRDLEIDAKNVLWDMELFQSVGNILSSVTGGIAPGAGKPSKTQSALAGMASGAAAGATVGSAIPGVGTAMGAAAGGLIGAIGGYQYQ